MAGSACRSLRGRVHSHNCEQIGTRPVTRAGRGLVAKQNASACIVIFCTCAGDFPDVNRYREILSAYDLSVFPKLREKDVKTIEDVLSLDIPSLVKQFDNPYQ